MHVVNSYRFAGEPLVTEWTTPAANSVVRMPSGANTVLYNAIIDWGDGSQSTITSHNDPDLVHTYTLAGTYIAKIFGVYQHFEVIATEPSRLWLKKLSALGTVGVIHLSLVSCTNLTTIPIDGVNAKTITSLYYGFTSCPNVTNWSDLSSWDVSNVRSFEYCFAAIGASFNPDISGWNTASMISMKRMFHGCTTFNQPIGNWDTGNLLYLEGAFFRCYAFNQSLAAWDTSKVTLMDSCFANATSFDQNLNSWDFSKVTSITGFLGYSMTMVFNNGGIDIDWNTDLCTSMSAMFSYNRSLNVNITLNTENVTDFSQMFAWCDIFNKPVTSITTEKATNLYRMFVGCNAFNQSVAHFNTSLVTNLSGMFSTCYAFNQPLSTWNTSKVTNMSQIFQNCHAFNQSLAAWDTSKVTTMKYLFYGAGGAMAFNQPLSTFDTTLVTDMAYMFYNCRSFDQDISNFSTANVTSTSYMFYNCFVFNQPISFSLPKCTDLSYMFSYCAAFNQPVLLTNLGDSVSTITMAAMFMEAKEFNQNLNSWNFAKVTDLLYFLGHDTSGGKFNNGGVAINWNTLANTRFYFTFYGNSINFNVPVTLDASKCNRTDSMFQSCTVFNQQVTLTNLGSDPSISTINMVNMFYSCPAYKQDSPKNWDITKVNNLTNFMLHSTLPSAVYDSILVAWELLDLTNGLTPHFGLSKYTATGETAKNAIISADAWTFTDGGLE